MPSLQKAALIVWLAAACVDVCRAQSVPDAASPASSLEFPYTDAMSDAAIASSPQVATLAKVLAAPELKGTPLIVACRVVTGGSDQADQELSVRCAERVRGVLIEKFGAVADTLIAVGYGKSKLKNPANPAAIENQRLEIVRMGPSK